MGRRYRNTLTSFFTIVLCVLVLVSCKSNDGQDSVIEMVNPDEMQSLIKTDNTQLIDVRNLEEFEEGHIKGAKNLILNEDFKQRYDKLDKSKPVVLYCEDGNESEKCAQILKDAGFKKIFDLRGGLSQWMYEGKEVVN